MLVGSIVVNAFQLLCLRPTPGTRGNQGFMWLFLAHLRYSTLLYGILLNPYHEDIVHCLAQNITKLILIPEHEVQNCDAVAQFCWLFGVWVQKTN